MFEQGMVEDQLSTKFHPVANIFPLMSEDEIDDLAEDINTHGQREAVWLHPDDDRIVDGRSRWLACDKAGIDCKTQYWDEAEHGELVAFVMSLNYRRRHLSVGQRAMVAAKAVTFQHAGGDRRSQSAQERSDTITQAKSAATMKVSERTLQHAKTVIDHGATNVISMVERGELTPKTAAAAVKAQPDAGEQAKWATLKDVKKAAQNGTAKPKPKPKEPDKADKPTETTALYEATGAADPEAQERLAQIKAAFEIADKALMSVVKRTGFETATPIELKDAVWDFRNAIEKAVVGNDGQYV